MPRVPDEIRGVHLTMGLASDRGQARRVPRATRVRPQHARARRQGRERVDRVRRRRTCRSSLTTSERRASTTTGGAGERRRGGRRLPHRPRRRVRRSDAGPGETGLALQWPDGTAWRDPAGLAWLNPYDKRAWRYVVDVAAAAAKAGFDEIQFDYVRFPSDGDLESIVYPMTRKESKERTIERFLAYASKRLRRSASACRRTSSVSPPRAISASASRRRCSAATSTRSTRWSTRRTTCPASTT